MDDEEYVGGALKLRNADFFLKKKKLSSFWLSN